MATTEERVAVIALIDRAIPDTQHGLVDSCIATAGRIVQEQLSSSGLSAGTIEDIKRYLSAHFLALTVERGSVVSERIGESSAMYGYAYGRGLRMTRFGETVLMLDTTGILASSTSSQLRAELVVV